MAGKISTQIKPKMEDTEVTKWLKNIKGVSDNIIQLFYDKEYYDLADLTDGDIDNYVKKEEHEVLNRRLKRLLNESKNPKPAPNIKLPDLPKVGVADLSQPELKVDGVTYTLPTLLPASASGEIIRPGDLTEAQWVAVVRNSNALYGRRLNNDGKLDYPRYPVLHWKFGNGGFHRNAADESKIDSIATYSERDASWVSSGIYSNSAGVGVGYSGFSVTGAVRVGKDEKSVKINKSTDLYIVGLWDFPRAKLVLDESCVKVSEDFEIAIESALNQKDDKAKYDEIKKVFHNYGYIYPTEVLLGGRLYSVHQKTVNNDSEMVEARTNVSAAVGLKAERAGFGGEVNYAHDEAKGNMHSEVAQKISESLTFQAIGGDVSLANRTDAWPATVKDPNNWAVIELAEFNDTIKLLSPETEAKVKDIVEKFEQPGLSKKISIFSDEKISQHDPLTSGYIQHEFPAPFQDCPMVISSLRELGASEGFHSKVAVRPDDLRKNMFYLNYDVKGRVYSFGATSLAISNDLGIQAGVDDQGFAGQCTKDTPIKFATSFDALPKVMINLVSIYTSHNQKMRIIVTAGKPDNDGFILHYQTWGDSHVYDCKASWIAVPKDESRVQVGTSSWHYERPNKDDKGHPLNTGKGNRTIQRIITFEKPFQEKPEVIVGLSALGLDNQSATRVEVHALKDSITEKGFVLEFSTWKDSVVYLIGVNWMAIDKSLIV